MKKPKITEGKWKYRYNGHYYDIKISAYSFITTTQNETLEFNIGLTKDVELANARAISAVPEMIDALVEMYHLIQSLKQTSEWGVNVYPIDEENVINALKKAGCTE